MIIRKTGMLLLAAIMMAAAPAFSMQQSAGVYAADEDEAVLQEEAEPTQETESDLDVYHLMYIQKYADARYVNAEEPELDAFIAPVTVARGVATYNDRCQGNFEITSNFLASFNYEIPVYDVDENSDYYVAVPNVNLGSEDIRAYDLSVAYNNNEGETISGCRFARDILYIPKEAVDHPKNREALIEDNPIAIQLNYAFGMSSRDGEYDFGKSIPAQILRDWEEAPSVSGVSVDNLFTDSITVPDVTGGRRGYSGEDISVFLNGMILPVSRDVWELDGGDLIIHAYPAVVSSINVVVGSKAGARRAVRRALTFLAERIYADKYTKMSGMKPYRHNGKEVEVTFKKGQVFVGWRGYYKASVKYGRDILSLRNTGVDESFGYAYGGYAKGRRNTSNPNWALYSYATGTNKARGVSDTLSKDKKVYENEKTSGEKKTIYEWMLIHRNHLNKIRGNLVEDAHNGVGGVTNYAFSFPEKITGSMLSLVSSGENDGRKNGDVTFDGNLPDPWYMVASCAHLDATQGSDAAGSKSQVYVACLGLEQASGGTEYVILSFTCNSKRGADKQEGSAIYKFRVKSTGKIKLIKQSADKAFQPAREGIEYTVYKSNKKTKVGTLTCKSDGTTNVLSGLPAGTYYAKETKTNANYELNPSWLSCTVKFGGTGVFKAVDDPVGKTRICVQKKLSDPEAEETGAYPLDGIRFQLYEVSGDVRTIVNDSEGNPVVLTTDQDGLTETAEVEAGKTYCVREISVPEGRAYTALAVEPNVAAGGEIYSRSETAAEGRTTRLTFVNQPEYGSLVLTKTLSEDSAGGGTADGFTFVITNQSTKKQYRITTGKNGNAITGESAAGTSGVAGLADLPLGAYTIEEELTEEQEAQYESVTVSPRRFSLTKDRKDLSMSWENRYGPSPAGYSLIVKKQNTGTDASASDGFTFAIRFGGLIPEGEAAGMVPAYVVTEEDASGEITTIRKVEAQAADSASALVRERLCGGQTIRFMGIAENVTCEVTEEASEYTPGFEVVTSEGSIPSESGSAKAGESLSTGTCRFHEVTGTHTVAFLFTNTLQKQSAFSRLRVTKETPMETPGQEFSFRASFEKLKEDTWYAVRTQSATPHDYKLFLTGAEARVTDSTEGTGVSGIPIRLTRADGRMRYIRTGADGRADFSALSTWLKRCAGDVCAVDWEIGDDAHFTITTEGTVSGAVVKEAVGVTDICTGYKSDSRGAAARDFTLKAGEAATFIGLDPKASYIVTERGNAYQPEYALTRRTGGNAAVISEDTGEKGTAFSTEKTFIPSSGGVSDTVTFTNAKDTRHLKVTKTTNLPSDQTQFSFRVNAEGAGKASYLAMIPGNASVQLHIDGEGTIRTSVTGSVFFAARGGDLSGIPLRIIRSDGKSKTMYTDAAGGIPADEYAPWVTETAGSGEPAEFTIEFLGESVSGSITYDEG